MYILETKVTKTHFIKLSLSKIYGIGHSRALLICKKLGFSKNLKLKHLSEDQILKIIKLIELLKFSITSDLKQFRVSIIKKLVFLKSYRGFRRIKGLPVRGQRTHTNAKSAKNNQIKF